MQMQMRQGGFPWHDWLELTRPFSWTATLVPVAVGAAVAGPQGPAAAVLPLLALGVVLAQAGTNAINEFFDVARGVDTASSRRASRVLLERRLPPRTVYVGGLALLALGVVTAAAVSALLGLGPIPLLFGAAGALLGYAYTAPPLALKYRGLGLPVVALVMGPSMVLAAQYVLSGRWSEAALWASLPVGCLVGAIVLANDLRDLDGDRAAGIRTSGIVLGQRAGWAVYLALLAGAFATLAVGVAVHALPWQALLAVGSAPLAVQVAGEATGRRAPDPAGGVLARLDARSAQVHLLFGLLLAAGLGLAHLGR